MGSVPVASRSQWVHYEEYSQDINTPLEIPVLDGDKYDFDVIIQGSSAADTNLIARANNDASASGHRSYYMKGNNSSEVAVVDDTTTGMQLLPGFKNGFPSLMRIRIVGESGDERPMSALAGSEDNLIINDSYFRNTADPITSIGLFTPTSTVSTFSVAIFATPKNANQEQWEIIKHEPFTSRDLLNNPIDFTGLDGDVDNTIRVDYYSTNAGNSPRFTIDNDGSAVYEHQRQRNFGGSLSAANTLRSYGLFDAENMTMTISAKSGQNRLITLSDSRPSQRQTRREITYQNSADNINSIQITAGSASLSDGYATIWRKRTVSNTVDTLPWETVKEFSISGDFSAGEIFDNLDSENVFLYQLTIEGAGNAGVVYAQFESDTSPNYPHQQLLTVTSTVSAGSGSARPGLFLVDSSAQPFTGSAIIYPKSGQERPALTSYYRAENTLNNIASWWDNTADPIGTIKVFSNNASSIDATLRLSKIPIIQA